jgi:hypothetical protein
MVSETLHASTDAGFTDAIYEQRSFSDLRRLVISVDSPECHGLDKERLNSPEARGGRIVGDASWLCAPVASIRRHVR